MGVFRVVRLHTFTHERPVVRQYQLFVSLSLRGASFVTKQSPCTPGNCFPHAALHHAPLVAGGRCASLAVMECVEFYRTNVSLDIVEEAVLCLYLRESGDLPSSSHLSTDGCGTTRIAQTASLNRLRRTVFLDRPLDREAGKTGWKACPTENEQRVPRSAKSKLTQHYRPL
jgi:hypothetical protein